MWHHCILEEGWRKGKGKWGLKESWIKFLETKHFVFYASKSKTNSRKDTLFHRNNWNSFFISTIYMIKLTFKIPYTINLIHVGAAFRKVRYPLTISIGKLRIEPNSMELLYCIPVLGSLYLAWKGQEFDFLSLTKILNALQPNIFVALIFTDWSQSPHIMYTLGHPKKLNTLGEEFRMWKSTTLYNYLQNCLSWNNCFFSLLML